MKSNKIFHIKECYFNLPDNFDGTLADALMLMANRAVQAKAYNEIYKHENVTDLHEHLIKADRSKCVIEYEFI